ncbi:hypothetical protein ASPWEDRAFT_171112 [Aspergillus wentii DTO 134E9]|uniref:Gamma-glutamylcyclotransferase AIG2-like domain-containing protein n=1 Tax=Aspergillus wentii DTO 134E9 TaxID=1073089 RepID=A0A1L9RRS5_ASPWE|nr:uncharacterized protein ASPWEDRAFT_171112 [Aspergillus wentii DTO 134E9]KAI9930484.1 hypothetical protein MW887_011238 [Aspergillus wentii]OJJ37641.1 hypothetical protein ASPWEDRAFT_171112 [Aspergillus wentii DTO 134E9]
MELKPWYPRDFGHVLSNTLSEEEVTIGLNRPGCSPRFVYGILMLPTILKYYIDMDPAVNIHKNMIQATLTGYKLHQFAESGTPVITPSSDPQATVKGVLIFGLNEHQRNSIYELEAGLMNLVNVQVEISQKDTRNLRSRRVVEAGAFAWQGPKEGLTPMGTTTWPVDEFLAGPFYENIVHAQQRASMGGSAESESTSRVVRLSQRQGSMSSSPSRRFESSLDSIKEEIEVMNIHDDI